MRISDWSSDVCSSDLYRSRRHTAVESRRPMKRIDIVYGGQSYSVGQRDIDELRAEILAKTRAEGGYWLEVNSGEGAPRPTFLLITASTDIALIPIPGEERSEERRVGKAWVRKG